MTRNEKKKRLLSPPVPGNPLPEETVETIRKLSESGRVIYAMRSSSVIAYFWLNRLLRQAGLPPFRFCNDPPLFLRILRSIGRLFSWKKHSSEGAEWIDTGDSALLFLKRPDTLFGRFFRLRSEAFHALIGAQRRMDRPIFIVPMLVLWTNRPERWPKSLIDVIFGGKGDPGFWRELILSLGNYRRMSIVAGEPISLSEFLAAYPQTPDRILVKRLRLKIARYLQREQETMVGPRLKSRQRIIRQVLRDRELVRICSLQAASENRSYRAVERKARRYLREIAADYTYRYIQFLRLLMDWAFRILFVSIEVDEKGLEKLRETSRRAPLIILPSHKSHIDYLLVSYVFYGHGLMLPHIAAGINLSFWPLGFIFRKAGAFFIRRSFRGNRLYSEVLSRYLRCLIKERYPIEFFIEGGRSRTGKVLNPKLGLLTMAIKAYLEDVTPDLAFIPIYIGYERLLEEGAYLQELKGGTKKPEDIKGLLRIPRLLRRKYGRVYLEVGTPLFASEFFPTAEKRTLLSDRAKRRRQIYHLAVEVAHRINQATVATPVNVVAAAILGQGTRGITGEDLRRRVDFLSGFLSLVGAKRSRVFATKGRRAVDQAIEMLVTERMIQRITDEEGTVYLITPGKHLNLDLYKNSILHFYQFPAYAALAILEHPDGTDRESLLDAFSFLRRLLAFEFIDPPDGRSDEVLLDAQLALFQAQGWIEITDAPEGNPEIRVTPAGSIPLAELRLLFVNFLESYRIVVRAIRTLHRSPKAQEIFLKKIIGLGHKMELLGEIEHPEALSKSNYQNALVYFLEQQIIGRKESVHNHLLKKRVTVTEYVLLDTVALEEHLRRISLLLTGRIPSLPSLLPTPPLLPHTSETPEKDRIT